MAKNETAVEITYRSAELQPPLWVAGTFSSPPWTPFEMDHTTAANGETVFTKGIRAKPGTSIQYKFRVGSGDWWVLDESRPTVTDDMGNRNNLLEVHGLASDTVQKPPTPPPDSPGFRPADAGAARLQIPDGGPLRSDASTPSFVRTTMEVADTAAQLDAGAPGGGFDAAAEDFDVDIGPEFPHERPGENVEDQDIAPVFAYEFAGTYDVPANTAPSEYSPRSNAVLDPDEDEDFDPKDPTLERFPSNREDILSRVRTLESGLDEDVTNFDGYPASPVVSPGRKSSFGSIDAGGDSFALSPTATAAWPPAARRQDPSKRTAGRDSLVADPSPSPSPSLHCIVEEAAPEEQPPELLPESIEQLSPISLQRPAPAEPATPPAESPAIIIHRATEDERAAAANGLGTVSASGDADAGEVAGPRPQSGAPGHQPSATINAGQTASWFTGFFRLVFVEWLGRFLGGLFRWQRQE